jgi:hypothetical protein
LPIGQFLAFAAAFPHRFFGTGGFVSSLRGPRNKADDGETIFAFARRHPETTAGYSFGNKTTGRIARKDR